MPQLHYRYGTMNSAKTASLLMMANAYGAKANLFSRVCIIKPQVDTRFGNDFVASRVGVQRRADIVLGENACALDAVRTFEARVPDTPLAVVLVDECQFLTAAHVEALRLVALRVNVFCFGLRTDYRGYLFPGSRRLLELADTIEELKTTCTLCPHKAVITAKFYVDEEGRRRIIREGSDQPDLGAEEKYTALCFACWNEQSISAQTPPPPPTAAVAAAAPSGAAHGPDTPGTCSEK